MKGDLSERVRGATADLMNGLSLELVSVEVSRSGGRTILRLSIDKPGGVTVDDCARASDLIGKVLEREDVVGGGYTLEVMSPGLDRPLRGPADFDANVGKRVKVKLTQPFEGRRSFAGILRSVDTGGIVLDLGEEIIELSYEGIAGARLEPELPW